MKAILFLLLSASAFGQSAVQIFEGKVLDPAGAPIEGASVELSPGKLSAITGANGAFRLQAPVGRYTLSTSKEGFRSSEVSLDLSQKPMEITLELAPVQSTVTITEQAGYLLDTTNSATKTPTPLRDIPQSITVVTQSQIRDQMMMSIADVVRYVPGIVAHQGENNRDQLVIRGNNTTADFFVNGVRDDVQYFRDLYNLDRIEAIKGPNAVIFGRGGAGGVINRVTKEAGFTPLRELSLQTGSFGNKRAAFDFDQPLAKAVAFRMNGMYENSGSFRDHVGLERFGISPTLTLQPGAQTKITLSYENFQDRRTADRGISSFGGRPLDIPISTYFGNPNDSRVKALVNLGAASVEHQWGGLNLRNRTQVGGYDKFYRNYLPGAVAADRNTVALSAYDNATQRLNIFNQTDLNYSAHTGSIRHTLLGGMEVGRQFTDNFRNTGFFNNTATSTFVSLGNPLIATPATFRQGLTEADNHVRTTVAATYFQDQIQLSRYVQITAGIRIDRFDLQYQNNRNGEQLRRIDNLLSPRAGLVIKPVDQLSLYGSYSVSYLPSSGDQFASLTTITQQVKPEKFSNYEAGVKWDIARSLSLTAAIYRLDRTNTRSTDPNDPTRIVQTGSQRTNGFEAGATGGITRKWKVAGGYAYQDAFVSSATTAALAGAQVAQVPHHTFSLWNNYQILPRLGAGLGLLNRTDMFTAIDNTVTLPGYVRADAAIFFALTEKIRLQANIENLTDRRYYANADSNTNITPGSPRAIRVGLIARF